MYILETYMYRCNSVCFNLISHIVGMMNYDYSIPLPSSLIHTQGLPGDTTNNLSISVPLGEQGTQVAVLQVDHAGGQCSSWGIIDRLTFSVDGFQQYSRLLRDARYAPYTGLPLGAWVQTDTLPSFLPSAVHMQD